VPADKLNPLFGHNPPVGADLVDDELEPHSRRSVAPDGHPQNPYLAAWKREAGKLSPCGHSRNEACWCGSDRKWKACHLRVTALPALPARFKRVLAKPIVYLDRRGGRFAEPAAEVAWQLADEQSGNLAILR
jgi:hypothetical protein